MCVSKECPSTITQITRLTDNGRSCYMCIYLRAVVKHTYQLKGKVTKVCLRHIIAAHKAED